jgi:hypothetical protein
MLYRKIIAVWTEIQTEHMNSMFRQNADLWMLNLVVYIVTTGLLKDHENNSHLFSEPVDKWGSKRSDTW